MLQGGSAENLYLLSSKAHKRKALPISGSKEELYRRLLQEVKWWLGVHFNVDPPQSKPASSVQDDHDDILLQLSDSSNSISDKDASEDEDSESDTDSDNIQSQTDRLNEIQSYARNNLSKSKWEHKANVSDDGDEDDDSDADVISLSASSEDESSLKVKEGPVASSSYQHTHSTSHGITLLAKWYFGHSSLRPGQRYYPNFI